MRESLHLLLATVALAGCLPDVSLFEGDAEPYCWEKGVVISEQEPVVLATGAAWRPSFAASGEIRFAVDPPGVLAVREATEDLEAVAPGRATVTVEDRTCDSVGRIEVEVRDPATVAVEPISMAWLDPLPRDLAPAGLGIPPGGGVTLGVIRRDANGVLLQGELPNDWTLDGGGFDLRPYDSPDSDHGDHARVQALGEAGQARIGAAGAEAIDVVAVEADPIRRIAAHLVRWGVASGGVIEVRAGSSALLHILGYDAAGRLVSELGDRGATATVEPAVARAVVRSGRGVYVELAGLEPGEGTVSVRAYGLPLEVPIRVVAE